MPVGALPDMLTLFEKIPLEQMNTSMTINATAPWLLALYIVTAERQGAARDKLAGTVQNDLIKEYLSRGTYMFPPRPSLKLTADVIAFTVREMPLWNPVNVCCYHLQEAGATPVQELAYALAAAIAILDAVRAGGQVPAADFPRVVGRISFFVNAGLRFVNEMCKMRAFVEPVGRICEERYGVADPKLRTFRYGVQVNSLGLTEQQPENNVYRILLETLAVVLSKSARARAVQLPAWNEALGLPREWDQQWSLRLQQILAYETDLLEYGDLFDGSPVVAAKVAELCDAREAELARIDEHGRRARRGRSRLHQAAPGAVEPRAPRAIAAGTQKVVGVNCFTESAPSPLAAGAAAACRRSTPRPRRARSSASRRIARAATRRPSRTRSPRSRPPPPRSATSWSPRSPARAPASPPASGPTRCARCSASTGRRPGSPAPAGRRGGRARGGAGPRRALADAARPAAQDAGRQARARRPLQRRRADRGARPRLRLRGGLRRHPAEPARIAQPRSRRASTSSASRSSRARTAPRSPR